jgi:hypothetical protein
LKQGYFIVSDFKIEIGKSYKTRSGNLPPVKIIGVEDKHAPLFNPAAPYLGDDDEVYTSTGRFNGQSFESEFDLIEEISQ